MCSIVAIENVHENAYIVLHHVFRCGSTGNNSERFVRSEGLPVVHTADIECCSVDYDVLCKASE